MGKYLSLCLAAAVGACGTAGEGGAPPGPERQGTVTIDAGSRGLTGELGGVVVYNEPGVGSRHVAAPLDSVLMALPAVYTTLGVPDHGIDPETRVYGNRNFRPRRIEGNRLSNYIDCGQGLTAVPNADEYAVTMLLVTALAPGEEGGTVVTTTLDATARPRGATGNPIHCQSKGELEMRVAQLVMWVLVGGEGRN